MRNEIKLSFEEPKYHIDLANKVVVCLLKGKPLLPRAIDYSSWGVRGETFPDTYETKGIARLSAEDVFDEVIGMKVALAKAENEAYKALSLDLKNYMLNINKVINQCKDFFWKSANVIGHNEDYLKQF